MSTFRSSLLSRTLLMSAALSLAACNDDDRLPGQGPGDGHEHVESAGRLVIGKAAGAESKAVVYDLHDEAFVGELPLRYAPTALYASPEGRYAVVVQAADGQVNFVDGGIWLHGDHAHADAPELLSFELSGAKPAHYRVNAGQAALFYDGEGSEPARFELLTEASIGSGQIVAAQALPAPVHGIAEPRDGAVLSMDYSLAEAADGAVRSAVKQFELHGDHFHDEGRFDTLCENLHGGSSNHSHSVFGCADGVLVIGQDGGGFTDAKIAIEKRITQVAGHEDADLLGGFAGDGTLYAIDPAAGTAEVVDWGAAEGVGRRQHTFDAHGEHLLILDTAGVLHVLEAGADGFERKGSVRVLDSDDAAARIATSGATHQAFVTDPAGQAVVVVDLEAVDVVNHVDLDFAPVGVTWLGIAEEGHAH